MLRAFVLALAQLADRRTGAVLAKSAALTLALVALLGAGCWAGLQAALAAGGLDDRAFAGGGALRNLIALFAAIAGAWLLFRLVALAVLEFYADAVIAAVEARHYPAAAARARPLGFAREARLALAGLGRAALWNLLALPLAAVLVVTAIGPLAVFAAVNALLIGRELTDAVRWRHPGADGQPRADLPWPTRLALGGTVVALLTVPLANLLAPVIGAAMATHLWHQREGGHNGA